MIESGIDTVEMEAGPRLDMYDLCRRRLWRRVEWICGTSPTDAALSSDDGYLLHIACKYQPTVRVVRTLLETFPQAVRLPNAKGELPLHEACRFNASISVIKELAEHYPAAAAAYPSAITILCNARESTETNMEPTNSAVLWHARKDDLRPVNYSSMFWQKIQVLLEACATHRQRMQDQSTVTLYILHAAVSLGCCPTEILLYCFSQYPDQISTFDERGRLPLHIAVSVSTRTTNESLLRKLQLKERSNVIRLLEQYPQAAGNVDPNEPCGRYPLHTALANGHGWHGGVKELFQHYPDSVGLPDPVVGLYPFQMATHDLDSVFQLLRIMPAALSGMRAKPASEMNHDLLLAPEETTKCARQADNKTCGLDLVWGVLVSVSLMVSTFWNDLVNQGKSFFQKRRTVVEG